MLIIKQSRRPRSGIGRVKKEYSRGRRIGAERMTGRKCSGYIRELKRKEIYDAGCQDDQIEDIKKDSRSKTGKRQTRKQNEISMGFIHIDHTSTN